MGGDKKNIEFLVNRISNGSESAFEAIFSIYYPRLQQYANSILHSNQEAEDLVQEVFVQIWNKKSELQSERHFGAYIFTLVKNRCLNSIKRKIIEDKYIRHQAYYESEELYHISFEVEDQFSSMEDQLISELEKVINKMPERCQIAFRFKWLEGKKIREIAEIMEISTTMVDKHLAKGIQIARELLNPDLFLFLFISRG